MLGTMKEWVYDADHEPAEPEASMPEADDFTPEAYDEYLTAELLLPNMGTVTEAKVVGRKRDKDGNPIGKRNTNPILDTREYEVEFQDGATDTFTANIIADKLVKVARKQTIFRSIALKR
jgi:hypothetical protein